MLRHVSLLVLAVTLAVAFRPGQGFAASAGTTSGKTCRMEQQCRWENFKKICT